MPERHFRIALSLAYSPPPPQKEIFSADKIPLLPIQEQFLLLMLVSVNGYGTGILISSFP